MKDKPSNERTLQRIAGVIRARRRGDITANEAWRNLERIVREESVAVARRKVA
jgi:hypothetical protein